MTLPVVVVLSDKLKQQRFNFIIPIVSIERGALPAVNREVPRRVQDAINSSKGRIRCIGPRFGSREEPMMA